MAIVRKMVTMYRCERCGYEWLPRYQDSAPPTVCANLQCKSPYWNRPRQRQVKLRGKRPADRRGRV